jgi:hypothetical protein
MNNATPVDGIIIGLQGLVDLIAERVEPGWWDHEKKVADTI